MDQVKFPEWTPPDLIRCYEEVKQDANGDEDLLACFYRLGTEDSMQGVWAWLLDNQKKDIPRAKEESAEQPLVVQICNAIAWGINVAKMASDENPIPLNESNKKLKAIIKKTESLIDDIKSSHQASKISDGLIGRLIANGARKLLSSNGLNGNLLDTFRWQSGFTDLFENLRRSISNKDLKGLCSEDRAILMAHNSFNVELVDALQLLCRDLNIKIQRSVKMSKSTRVYMIPNLREVFEAYFDQVPRKQFCELVSVVEFDEDKGFNPLTWDDIKPYLSRK